MRQFQTKEISMHHSKHQVYYEKLAFIKIASSTVCNVAIMVAPKIQGWIQRWMYGFVVTSLVENHWLNLHCKYSKQKSYLYLSVDINVKI